MYSFSCPNEFEMSCVFISEMKFRFIFLVVIMVACSKSTIPVIFGDWEQIEQREKINNNWSDWVKIKKGSTPALGFTRFGTILYDGKTPKNCCQYLRYEIKSSQISLFDFTPATAFCDCYPCGSWQIVEQSEDSLILSMCLKQVKYVRVK